MMVEQGYVVPGSMVVGSDSHSNLYGALCCLGTPVVRTDAASIWATGVTWWQVPPVARLILHGKLRPGVTGKDVIVTLCGLFNKDEVLNHAVEFVGDGVASLSVEQRMTIANMTTEWGALVGLFPFDEALRDYLLSRADYFAEGMRPGRGDRIRWARYTREQVEKWWSERESMKSDAGAAYAIELELDLDTVTPYVCGPNDVKTMASLAELEPKQVAINKAWLMSCVNARSEDLAEAACRYSRTESRPRRGVLSRGRQCRSAGASQASGPLASARRCGRDRAAARLRHVHRLGPRARSRPAKSASARPIAISKGGWATATGLSISARRPSSRPARSPAISPRRRNSPTQNRRVAQIRSGARSASKGRRDDRGFSQIRPRPLWFLDRDNLNTDGIYAGKHTYNDAMTPEQMAVVIFENYDPNLRARSCRKAT